MRRLFAITTICVLLAAPALPMVATSCPHTQMAKACHRAEHAHAHHCDEMATARTNDADADEALAPTIAPSEATAPNCPMDCCSAGERTNAIALSAAFETAPLAVQGHNAVPVSAIFTTPGFSSHTDRGPPAA